MTYLLHNIEDRTTTITINQHTTVGSQTITIIILRELLLSFLFINGETENLARLFREFSHFFAERETEQERETQREVGRADRVRAPGAASAVVLARAGVEAGMREVRGGRPASAAFFADGPGSLSTTIALAVVMIELRIPLRSGVAVEEMG
ncbi:hypothetical protein EVAR_41395_1 [Eumeta japonica]|uniref:Uncharacterized protein n=1 Tax=Eumeta variegata TaxID=151549 RepID=A0A4C1X1G8_EUMVA|nr:hypothetical protein EVAR_41395_1 [Eumeta japonica]